MKAVTIRRLPVSSNWPQSINLDASAFRPYKGNSVYTLCLVRELSRLGRFSRLTVQTSERNHAFFAALEGEVNVNLLPVKRGRLNRFVGRPIEADHDLSHLPGGQEPIFRRGRNLCPSIFTFHDANYLQGKGPVLWRVYKILSIAAMLRRSTGVIFISRFAKDEFCRIPTFERRIASVPHRVIWNGSDFPCIEPGATLKSGPWICFSNQSHKRPDIAIAAFEERWCQRRRDNESMVVIGRRPTGFTSCAPVEFRADLGQSKLIETVSAAKGLLFPSEYEGFGLPVLEAAVSGVPVIANNLPAVREVFGDAISYAKNNSVGEYVAWMNKFDQQPSVVLARSRLAWERARQITWRRCAVDVAEFYNEAAEKYINRQS